MSAIREQVFAICNERETELYQMAEEYFGGECGVLAKLSDCTLPGIAGPIPFREVYEVAESKEETIHPNYLTRFKKEYLCYLLTIMWNDGKLPQPIAEELGFCHETSTFCGDGHTFNGAEFWHRD